MTAGSLTGTTKYDIEATPSRIFGNIVRVTPSGAPEDTVRTPLVRVTPSAREQIEGHISALRVRTVVTRKEIIDADLNRPFKEAVKTPLTRRIIEFVGLEFKMPLNIKLYDGTIDPEYHLNWSHSQ
uniref:Uncharacterized protein n=1 Tax=Tanacetum cinerariifolium TaxID=118510 RepID=A0A699W1Y7_TANCI|nr:hypothetical protein [Tanacetum cinerariifolium]